jgi:hypothetical protein
MPLKGLKIELDLHKRLKRTAVARGESMQTLVESALTQALDRLDAPVLPVPTIHSLLPDISVTLSPKDAEWLQALLKIGLERIIATPGHDPGERNNSIPPPDFDTRLEALRAKKNRIDDATRELQRAPAPDTGTSRRAGKGSRRHPKKDSGGSGD